ncbi:bifunctional folylpolyglutamate synthase/dihydrofolate synthase [Aromatoleum toluvorans]|uniref:Dihydrofolate synthase/folylpolyglutamate synthase n=1 Tax=Aromatoleum toluvorans TaxID=92002 RepID=A0ABX1PZU9_9RHOO|nr:folylpolyglutamate synthase/dihydrofolate synthase family protein [Aromatoleum toluvorans]NMG44157.1 bifunctional folylpolyglutamate synthase/dihydrofolate synthase [Aromatoleum toluvorans]
MNPPPGLADVVAQPLRHLGDVVRLIEALVAAELSRPRPPDALTLQPMGELLARIGNPQRTLRCIHVAGSKGKGSTALLCEAVLGAAGLRVGTYTSPHLQRWSERYRVGGQEVGEAEFVAAVERVRPHFAGLQGNAHPPSFFDFATATAFALFENAGVDVALIEVGLGGRLDPTNVITPLVSCITSIELEHTDRLGTTLAAIAGEKAGIIKPAVPVVIGDLPREALAVVEAQATRCAAPLHRLGIDFTADVTRTSADGVIMHAECGPLALDLTLPVLGRHLAGNAAMALACILHAGLLPLPQLADAARRGLAQVALPGRTEILGRRPWVIADGAHTESSARALMHSLDALDCRERHMVISISSGKDLAGLLPIFAAKASAFVVTRADRQRSLEPSAIADWIRLHFPGLPVRVVEDPLAAVSETLVRVPSDSLMCVTGSVYAAGAARTALALSPTD